jgi:ribosomal protein S18 acetylase RimI-like enzyme
VGPGRRNESIGSRLLERAVNELRDLGCVKINLQVYGGDESVTEFYQKNGFEVEDRISMGKEIPENIE